MAQTTGAMTGLNCPIEFSLDDTDWNNIAGSTTAIEPSEQTRMTGVAYTLDGDYAIITGGKKEPVEVEVKILYTTVSTEAYALVQAAWEEKPGLPALEPRGRPGRRQALQGLGRRAERVPAPARNRRRCQPHPRRLQGHVPQDRRGDDRRLVGAECRGGWGLAPPTRRTTYSPATP